jgi:transposase
MSARQSAAVDKALKLISKGLTPYAAAKKVGIALSTIYRAQKRQQEQWLNDPIWPRGTPKPKRRQCA